MTQDETFLSKLSKARRRAWQVLLDEGPSQIQFWFLALFVGIFAGLAAVIFRAAIGALQGFVYFGSDVRNVHSVAAGLPWYWLLIVPILGGFIVGLILNRYTEDARVRSVADVIEGAALHNGRVETKAGIASAFASLITLSTGGSSGREGPVVHLAGLISTLFAKRINASGITGRELLGCAVAAAVSASFNAPIAGALFALEVILRHYAVHAFAPIAIASIAGTVVSRLTFGNDTQFEILGEGVLSFYQELPAFLMLGLLSGVVAVVLMQTIFWMDDTATKVQRRIALPRYLRPTIAGALLGVTAIWFPHIIGVGYETTIAALEAKLTYSAAIIFVVVKIIAVGFTLGGRMGGGIFSPALMIGALTGLAFGLIATSAAPNLSSDPSLYALAGMGAVAAAVLGAPISTTLIVFELTGDWQTGLAVMAAVSLSTALASRWVDKSYFLTQLEKRDIHLAAGPQAYLLALFGVANIMRPTGAEDGASDETCWELIGNGIYVDASATLEQCMPLFEAHNVSFVPVVTIAGENASPTLEGALFHVDALKTFNRALVDTAKEEHD
ncbi:MAG: chloride channel protein [Pseudomonadota bacterium]